MPGQHIASVDGIRGPAGEATIAITDDGLLRGDGAFEVAQLYSGRPFGLGEHLDRLERSAAAIELHFDRAALEREIAGLLDEHGPHDGQLRIVITRGGRRIAICEQLPSFEDSLAVASVTYAPSIVLTGAKTLSYAANMQATRLARARGADEAVLVRPDGVVLEAPTSTIFWVSGDGELRTPSIESGILRSITRQEIVTALDVAEGEWRLEDLLGATEAFLASSAREVQAISRVDDAGMDVAPGPRASEAADAVRAAIEAELG